MNLPSQAGAPCVLTASPYGVSPALPAVPGSSGGRSGYAPRSASSVRSRSRPSPRTRTQGRDPCT